DVDALRDDPGDGGIPQVAADDEVNRGMLGEEPGHVGSEESGAAGDEHAAHRGRSAGASVVLSAAACGVASPWREPVRRRVCLAQRVATVRPAMMSQMPHQPATTAMPPSPPKKAKIRPSP